jgi:PKD repeat protein
MKTSYSPFIKYSIIFIIFIILIQSCRIVENLEPVPYIQFGSSFTAPPVVRVGEKVNFVPGKKTTGAKSFNWSFGFKGRTSQEQNPTFVYDSIGKYVVNLNVKMEKLQGVISSDTTREIIVIPPTDSVLYEESKIFGEDDVDEFVTDMARLNDGRLVLVGRENLSDMWIVLLDANGNLIDSLDKSSFKISNSMITPRDVQPTKDGGFVVVGSILSRPGDNDAFIIKFDQQGNVMWSNLNTNSSKDEYYVGSVEYTINGEDRLVVGLTSGSRIVLHQFTSVGRLIGGIPIGESNYLGEIDLDAPSCNSCKAEVMEAILVDNTQVRFIIGGRNVDNPMVMEYYANLLAPAVTFDRAITTLTNLSGVTQAVKGLTGGRYAIAGVLNRGNETVNTAFVARIDQIGSNISAWDRTFKLFSDSFIGITEDSQNNIVVVGVNQNPLSGTDISLSKFKRDGRGNLMKTMLIGDSQENTPTNLFKINNDLFIIGIHPEPSNFLVKRRDVFVLKTTTEF